MAKHLLFDLDGTLIDSSASILSSLATALSKLGMEPAVPLTPSLIGPPLRLTLARIAGCDDAVLLDRLSGHFRDTYDREGFLQTRAHPGVDRVLRSLDAAGKDLYIVTNKRILPTHRILDLFGWSGLFKGIHALDAGPMMCSDKAALVAHILNQHGIHPDDGVLIGDTTEDADAAMSNGLPFFGVSWGYGTFRPVDEIRVFDQAADILNM